MSTVKNELRNAHIKNVMDGAAKQLEALGVKYFIGVVDRDPAAEDGGKAFMQSDAKGEDMKVILDLSLPTTQDVINLGIWVGTIIKDRKEIAARAVTAKPKKANGSKRKK